MIVISCIGLIVSDIKIGIWQMVYLCIYDRFGLLGVKESGGIIISLECLKLLNQLTITGKFLFKIYSIKYVPLLHISDYEVLDITILISDTLS